MTSYLKFEHDFQAYVLDDAETSMALGTTTHLAQLGDPSLEFAQARNQAAQALLSEAAHVQTSNFDEQLNIDLMSRHLRLDIFFDELTQHGQPQRRRKPGGVDGISAGIFQLFVNDDRDAKLRIDDIVSRLQQAPAYLATEANVISEPITRWRNIELDQGEGLPDLFETIINWAKQESYPQLDALLTAVSQCNAALSAYLNDMQQRKTIDTFDIGEDNVKTLLDIRKITQSPEQLRQMAYDFMKETSALLETLRDQLCRKYQLASDTSQSELHEFLNEKFAAKLTDGKLDSVLDYYRQQISDINTFITERKLFAIPAQQDMVIMQTPGFLEPVIPAGAMWPPLALREGKKTSLVYLTLKEDELAEHTELGIPVMMIHEGIPGHHLQFATAAEHPAFIRRIYSANEHAEGWTTMLEDYMLDMGYIDAELVDEVRFIAKREMSRLVARVGIDLYFMTNNKQYLNVGLDLDFTSDDAFENAAKLLKEATGFTDGRVQAEINWYSTEQGYPLSYLTGNRLVWQLKQDILHANKKQLNNLQLDQAFHDIYLKSGCMPVNSLREVFTELGYL